MGRRGESSNGLEPEVIEKAAAYLAELKDSYFEVVLIPADPQKHSGHSLRALQSGNPNWYSRFCANYQSIRGRGRKKYRRPRTFIKRKVSLESLERLSNGEARTVYDQRFLDFIRREIEREKDAAEKERELENIPPCKKCGERYGGHKRACPEYEYFPF